MNVRNKWAFALVGSMAASALVGVACGSSAQSSTFTPGPDSGTFVPPSDATVPSFDVNVQPDVAPVGTLLISPQDQTIDVPPSATLQFHAYQGDDASTPLVASWSVDNEAIGTIDGNGLFTPTGAVGGKLNVYAQAGQAVGQTTLTVRVHMSDVPAGTDAGAFLAGGAADTNFKWLYPYDKTVFPRGLLAPRLQWSGTPPQMLYVTAQTSNFDYQGLLAPTNTDGLANAPPQLDLPQKVWDGLTQSAGPTDPVVLSVTKLDTAGGVTGPITESWTVAQGTLKGIVYYTSYDSPLAEGDGGGTNDQGAVMRIKPGASVPEVFIGGQAKGSCTVCHTLSANGSTMALSAGHSYDAVYSVTADASSPIGPVSEQPDNVYSFGALTPDGKYLLSCGSTGIDAGDAGPASLNDYGPNVVSMTHELGSQLFETADGGVVGAIPGVPKALMPAFSPDGKQIVFNRFVNGQDQRLAVAPFDESAPTFGAYTDVFVDPGFYLSWPTYLPDSQNFVFQVSDDTDQYSTYQQVTYRDANGELLVFMPSIHDVSHLREAMGQTRVVTDAGANLVTYLLNPDGTTATRDTGRNYEPTSLPVAAGGYYWVVFTSKRSYGNTIDNSDPQNTPANVKPKKLWVTAIDINATPGVDWSHPAFYLPGQELGAGNIRGFWTLEPCKGAGAGCQSGTECCNGFCREVPGDGGPIFACVPPPSGCANVDEKCTTTADCCARAQSGIVCIDGFCAIPTPK